MPGISVPGISQCIAACAPPARRKPRLSVRRQAPRGGSECRRPARRSWALAGSLAGLESAAEVGLGFGGIRGQGTTGDRNLVPSIPRNSTGSPANYKLDLRVARDIRVTERLRIELLAEGFNVFNRSNYNGFNTTLYNAAATTTSTPLSTPIQLTAVSNFKTPNNDASPPDGTNARRLQLALRFRF